MRLALLCSQDHATGKSFEHWRGWIAQRILELAAIFVIDVAAYAVMSNHYHLVVHIDAARAEGWDDPAVRAR